MIFQHTLGHVLNGAKTQTRRLAKPGDRLGRHRGQIAVVQINGFPRWVLGKDYAVHARRGLKAVPNVRVLITGLRREKDPSAISEQDAQAEGFATAADFVAAWTRLHGPRRLHDAVWVIEFKLIGAREPAASAAAGGGA